MDPLLGLGSADARPGPVISLVKVSVRGSSPFEDDIRSVLVYRGLEAPIHPSGFFFQKRTTDLKAGGQKSFQTSSLDQGMGIGAGKDHRTNSGCKDGLRAGRGSTLMIAGFQADVKGRRRSRPVTELVLLEIGFPSLERMNLCMGRTAGLVKTFRHDLVVQGDQGANQGVGGDRRAGDQGQFQAATHHGPIRWQRG